MLRAIGLRPTRQRLALGFMLFGKGDQHVTAEMLYEEAVKAKVPVSLATIYNTLHQFTDLGLLRQVAVDGSKTYFDTNVSEHPHFLLKARTISSTSRIQREWSTRGRRHPRAMKWSASTWWCDCVARAADSLKLAEYSI